MRKICSIDGCDRPVFNARGWCSRHYQRWRSSGNPLGKHKGMNGDTLKFIEIAKTYVEEDCLLWPYSRLPNGYAVIRIENKLFYVSRIICEQVNGTPLTEKHEAAHSCGNGHLGCVNPKHLRWATHKENMRDKIKHRTSKRGLECPESRGECNGNSKLTSNDVLLIRKSGDTGIFIAKRFDVSKSLIYAIRHNKLWKWL